jgi:hypothetical protein
VPDSEIFTNESAYFNQTILPFFNKTNIEFNIQNYTINGKSVTIAIGPINIQLVKGQ